MNRLSLPVWVEHGHEHEVEGVDPGHGLRVACGVQPDGLVKHPGDRGRRDPLARVEPPVEPEPRLVRPRALGAYNSITQAVHVTNVRKVRGQTMSHS